MSRLLTLIAPDRLGVGFRLLLGQSWLNALGGGMAAAAARDDEAALASG